MIGANELRKRFQEYFAKNGHAVVESSGLVPKDDPSLLFTNAGMVQFKKIFLGREKRDYNRAVTSQKCLRVGGKHNDLENVGRTARHHTFFEMLGNFSFGDYFKEQAIGFAWEFLTKDLGLPEDRMYATVFLEDDEAEELWMKVTGIPKERIYRLGEKDNFWSMGDTGPCGPCSEILFDQGEEMSCGPDCEIGVCDCDRYLEIWNLVFMQYNQDESGTRTPLPKPSIDTGMGLERIAAVCQGVQSNFDIDLFQDIIQHTAKKAGKKYKTDEDTDTALRVIADHSRASAFMIADGILPSNEGRGYVLRRLIRRAFRFGRLIGFQEPFLFDTAGVVVNIMGEAFPELVESRDFMSRVIKEEEERFDRTLDKGLAMLEEEFAAMKKAERKEVTGDFVFKLYDTFGFPIDIVNDTAEKEGFTVDESGFNELMAEQKERAKAAWKGSGEVDTGALFAPLLERGVTSEFVGYTDFMADSRIQVLLNESGEEVASISQGVSGFVVVDRTPFYGESGGQAGDSGRLIAGTGTAEVADTLKPSPELTVHRINVIKGEIKKDSGVELAVDEGLRRATARNHTSTHLLHAALRKVLGDHVKQSGSLVSPERLRFDFTHISPMTPEEITAVEDEVNRAILADIPVATAVMPYAEAVEKGAMALFGEKYADAVRVVEVPGCSVELCGGTHLDATGQAGPFMILSETGIAAGVRRIEGATGFNTLEVMDQYRREIDDISSMLKTRPGELADKVKSLRSEIKKLHKDLEKASAQAAMSGKSGGDIMDNVEEINGIKVLTAEVSVPNVKALRDIMDDVRSKLPSGIAALTAANGDKVNLILYVSKDLHDRFIAPDLIKQTAAEIDGSGGGRPDLAQAGGTNPKGVQNAFTKLKTIVKG